MKRRTDITTETVAPLYKRLRSIRKVAQELGTSPLTIRSRLTASDIFSRKKKNTRIRNMTLPEYRQFKVWKRITMERDGFTCQLCGQVGGELHTHHIKTWLATPDLRFDPTNGITLCGTCHRTTYKKEQDFEYIFYTLLTYQGVVPQWTPRPKQPKPITLACTKCGDVYPIEQFPPDRGQKWGIKKWCRRCHNAYNKKRTSENRSVSRRLSAAWYKKNTEYRKYYTFIWRCIRDLKLGKKMKKTKQRVRHGFMNEAGEVNHALVDDFIKNKGEAIKRIMKEAA